MCSTSKYIESEKMELKEKYTDGICREMVSFLNAGGGQIVIGVQDDGEVVGVQDTDEVLKKISDIVTSQIEPNPQEVVDTEVKEEEGKQLVYINISKGYNSLFNISKYGISPKGCPVRVGTTCKNMTCSQIKKRFEYNFRDRDYILKKPSQYEELSFEMLKIMYVDKGLHIDNKTIDKNYGFKNEEDHYNLLAELLADKNMIPLIFVKFRGLDKTSIAERSDYGKGCILLAYERIKNRIISENICVTDTTVRPRIEKRLFDYDCVNEALLNAIIHNDWTITEPQVSMFSDRIEILSHGGLPRGETEEDFYLGVSRPRNQVLMRVFTDLDITEHTGHGVPMIIKKYGKKTFQIYENRIVCTIPFNLEVLKQRPIELAVVDAKNDGKNDGKRITLTKTEEIIFDEILKDQNVTIKTISGKTRLSIRTIERAFQGLSEKKVIARIGPKRGGFWRTVRTRGVDIATNNENDVQKNNTVNDTINDTINETINPLNKTEREVYKIIMNDSNITSKRIAENTGKSLTTIKRVMSTLKEKNYIRREGSNKTGKWIIINK